MIQMPLAKWSKFSLGSIGNSLAARAVANRLGGWRVPEDSLPFGWSKSFPSARGEAGASHSALILAKMADRSLARRSERRKNYGLTFLA
jgi:hypothetical protein